jgi:hypothetical protein
MPVISFQPKVSLDPAVYYKTAGASYDRLRDNGPLTNEKIHQYALQGRYGPDAQYSAKVVERGRTQRAKARATKVPRKVKVAKVKKLTAVELFEVYCK